MSFVVEEAGEQAQRFQWGSPPGLTPSPDRSPNGFAIVAAGSALDASHGAGRALFFVSTDTVPWTVESSLSK